MDMDEITQVGTVELLRLRIYPLDANTGRELLATQVVVEPGTYPVYRDGDAVFWLLSGRLLANGQRKIGDGLFMQGGGLDRGIGPTFVFPSPRYGPDELAEFLAEPLCIEGDPAQRLRFHLEGSA
jgi:hypothetical protein